MAHTTEDFDLLVNKAMAEWHVPGLSIAVVQGDEIYAKGYGFARLPDEKVTEDTLFDCASTSKVFTAAAVASLVEDDENYPEVKWTTPVSKLLPDDFVLPDPQVTENVTVEDILSHRSGMPGHDQSYLGMNAKHPDTPQSVTRNLRHLPLSQPLRVEWQYCNVMFTAASYMVEVLSGEPYAEFLRSRLWKPLGMSNTYHDIDGVEAGKATDRLACGYYWDKDAESYSAISSWPQPEGQGAGGIFSSAKDYAKWVRALIKQVGPLPKSAFKELTKPRSILPVDEDDAIPFGSHPLYALGLCVESYRGHTLIGHDGGVSGFTSILRYMPSQEWGIYVIGNSNTACDVAEILARHLVDEVLKVPAVERVDWFAYQREQDEKSKKKDEEEDEDLVPPNPREDTSLPLVEYAGHYLHPGYHDLIIDLHEDGKLRSDCSDRCYPVAITYEHVSGDVFVAEVMETLDKWTRKVKAQFRCNADGRVGSVGIAFEAELKDELIWFERIA